jgi:ankyrin repeat protein
MDAEKAKAKAKARVDSQALDLGRPLHCLAQSLSNSATPEAILETAEVLLKASPETIDSPEDYGNTPLFVAMIRGNLPLVRFLMRSGASLDFVKENVHNLLHVAVLFSSAATLEFLLEVT